MREMILCMYSGGLDSVGMLFFLLTQPEYADFDVHVHHMVLENPENRARAEQIATMRSLDYLRANGFRAFSRSESLHRYPAFNWNMIWDADLCAFMAGNICNASANIRHVALGRTKTDIEHAGHDFPARMARAQAVFKAVKTLNAQPSEYIFPVAHLTKAELWEALPPGLRVLSWSCRRPVYDAENRPHVCGRCITCKAMGLKPDHPPATP